MVWKSYDDYLRGKDGYRKVIVDSRGHSKARLRDRTSARPGLVTTINLICTGSRRATCAIRPVAGRDHCDGPEQWRDYDVGFVPHYDPTSSRSAS